ncbi:MAG: helix-turn-helix domain-containing protein [Candidatus Competibacteraceae bacterium]|nr:helix-turn-helix domain-containing protein [Candidatus Competibacteraceae bacterium]
MNLHTLPSAEEIALAKMSSQELSAIVEAAGQAQRLEVIGNDGKSHQVVIPSSALKLLVEVLTQLGQGNSVNIIPVHAELTTQEAADILNMSRPTFIKLLDNQEIPYTRKGNRRKVAFADVMKYKNTLDRKRLEALDELSALDQELGMGY